VPTTSVTPRTGPSVTTTFLKHLPRFEAHARFAFRRLGCPHDRADRVAETIGLAWRHFAALSRRGKKPEEFVTTLALRCSQAVKAGRRLVGCETGHDILSPVAQVRHSVRVTRLPDYDRESDRHPLPGALADALTDNTRSAVPEQAAFRVDFPRWRASLRRRDRKILDALAEGERTADAARRFKLSPGRISQLRREFEDGWEQFQQH
jgi:DNA-directed RNA polymerase specialized sigma24 family protein